VYAVVDMVEQGVGPDHICGWVLDEPVDAEILQTGETIKNMLTRQSESDRTSREGARDAFCSLKLPVSNESPRAGTRR